MAHIIWVIKAIEPSNEDRAWMIFSCFKTKEEMVTFLAFNGFYIFGICIYEICLGLFEPSIERIRKESKENNEMHYLII